MFTRFDKIQVIREFDEALSSDIEENPGFWTVLPGSFGRPDRSYLNPEVGNFAKATTCFRCFSVVVSVYIDH